MNSLVAYSDSESDGERDEAPSRLQPTSSAPKPSFHTTAARKIRVDLPASAGTVEPPVDQPRAKRARTAGTFGGFNDLLPAPKRLAPPIGTPGRGVSLRTSSEAVFSRRPPPPSVEDETYLEDVPGNGQDVEDTGINHVTTQSPDPVAEIKIIGNATRFKPLSVANKKKPKKPPKPPGDAGDAPLFTSAQPSIATAARPDVPSTAGPPPPTRKSLFSMETSHTRPDTSAQNSNYKPMISTIEAPEDEDITMDDQIPVNKQTQAPTQQQNSLESIASDLDLTAAQRRQLFGRNANNLTQEVNVAHFNLNSEYASNEELRHSGQAMEHRAVKAIAPGKHSLQQLVNNARNNQESMEDKWAEGRRNRGEGGSKYGWGK